MVDCCVCRGDEKQQTAHSLEDRKETVLLVCFKLANKLQWTMLVRLFIFKSKSFVKNIHVIIILLLLDIIRGVRSLIHLPYLFN